MFNFKLIEISVVDFAFAELNKLAYGVPKELENRVQVVALAVMVGFGVCLAARCVYRCWQGVQSRLKVYSMNIDSLNDKMRKAAIKGILLILHALNAGKTRRIRSAPRLFLQEVRLQQNFLVNGQHQGFKNSCQRSLSAPAA